MNKLMFTLLIAVLGNGAIAATSIPPKVETNKKVYTGQRKPPLEIQKKVK
jgi:hypothetical protein